MNLMYEKQIDGLVLFVGQSLCLEAFCVLFVSVKVLKLTVIAVFDDVTVIKNSLSSWKPTKQSHVSQNMSIFH